jgi:hypothetical protein
MASRPAQTVSFSLRLFFANKTGADRWLELDFDHFEDMWAYRRAAFRRRAKADRATQSWDRLNLTDLGRERLAEDPSFQACLDGAGYNGGDWKEWK